MSHWQPQPLNVSLPLPIFCVIFSDQVRFLSEDEKHMFIFFLVLMPSRCLLVSHLCTLAFNWSFFSFSSLCLICCFVLSSSLTLSLAFDSLVIRKVKKGYAIATFTANCCLLCCCIFLFFLCCMYVCIIFKEMFRIWFATGYNCQDLPEDGTWSQWSYWGHSLFGKSFLSSQSSWLKGSIRLYVKQLWCKVRITLGGKASHNVTSHRWVASWSKALSFILVWTECLPTSHSCCSLAFLSSVLWFLEPEGSLQALAEVDLLLVSSVAMWRQSLKGHWVGMSEWVMWKVTLGKGLGDLEGIICLCGFVSFFNQDHNLLMVSRLLVSWTSEAMCIVYLAASRLHNSRKRTGLTILICKTGHGRCTNTFTKIRAIKIQFLKD